MPDGESWGGFVEELVVARDRDQRYMASLGIHA